MRTRPNHRQLISSYIVHISTLEKTTDEQLMIAVLALDAYFTLGDTIFSGITTASNCSAVTRFNSTATCFKVLPSL